MRRLHLGPTPEIRNRHQVQLRVLRSVLGRNLLVAWPIVVLRHNLLPFLAVQVLQVSLRHFTRTPAQHHLVNYGHRRLGENTDRRDNDLQFVGPKLLDGKNRLVLPRDQHIAQAALYERGHHCRPAA